MRELPKDVEVEIIFLPAEAGGRQGPAFSGYRPQFYYAGHDWDAIQTYPDVERVNPGDTVRAYLTFMSPEMHVGKICAGTMFLLREGHKTVGYGTGFLVNNVDEAVQAVKRLAGIDRAACRRRVEECFSIETMVKAYERVYRTIFDLEAARRS